MLMLGSRRVTESTMLMLGSRRVTERTILMLGSICQGTLPGQRAPYMLQRAEKVVAVCRSTAHNRNVLIECFRGRFLWTVDLRPDSMRRCTFDRGV